VVLVLVGLALFLVDLSVANHGLPTAGAIVALLAGGFALLVMGVPYSGVLLGAIAVVAVLMGGRALRGFALVACPQREAGHDRQGGDVRGGGHR
jgi:membrane protein implicated in regulation of membrane protease activity